MNQTSSTNGSKVLPLGLTYTTSGGYAVIFVRAWSPGAKPKRKYFGCFPAAQYQDACDLAEAIRHKYPSRSEARRKRLRDLMAPDTEPLDSTPEPRSVTSPPSGKRSRIEARPSVGMKSPRVAVKEPRHQINQAGSDSEESSTSSSSKRGGVADP